MLLRRHDTTYLPPPRYCSSHPVLHTLVHPNRCPGIQESSNPGIQEIANTTNSSRISVLCIRHYYCRQPIPRLPCCILGWPPLGPRISKPKRPTENKYLGVVICTALPSPSSSLPCDLLEGIENASLFLLPSPLSNLSCLSNPPR